MRSRIFLLSALLVAQVSAATDLTAVGVLDQPQCKQEENTFARLLFVKKNNRWVALNNEYEVPKNLTLTQPVWTIAFDGRSLGNLKLLDPSPSAPVLKDWFYARDKLYQPENQSKLPIVKNEAKMFGGWCQAPKNRPLVLVSKPNYEDPEKWKSFVPDQSYKKRMYAPLRLLVSRFYPLRCIDNAGHSEPWELKPEDVVLYKSYRSASGKELISVGVDPAKVGCVDVGESRTSIHQFLLDGENIDFLGTQMELVDAGDYDKDGHSELLFWYSGYNRDGYVIVYDNLRQKAAYIWGYH